MRRTAGYHFGVACVAVAMLVLPALYIGLVLLVAFLLYRHITTNLDLFRTAGIRAAVFSTSVLLSRDSFCSSS